MIRKKQLEDMGIDVPDDANRFFTEGSNIVFLVASVEEYGTSIVFKEDEIRLPLSEKQIESLKAVDCFGSAGWTLA